MGRHSAVRYWLNFSHYGGLRCVSCDKGTRVAYLN
jgi:hypothetical protein